MATRRDVHFATFLTLTVCFAWTSPLHAQEMTPAEIENSRYQFAGVVNSNAVFVRSGPSENDYPTLKLDKGAEITVVGHRFDWLKILPPDGSFCYVAKAYVDRRGNGSVGRVTSTLNVRVGSQLNELKAKIATKLEPGADVQIVGEEQEYFKIRPPEGVYYYVNKQFVEPIRPVNVADAGAPDVDRPPADPPHDPIVTRPNTDSPLHDPLGSDEPIVTEMPKIAVAPTSAAPDRREETAPATQPTGAAEAEFERLEGMYADASLKPLEDQPVEQLLEGYQKLATNGALPESLRRIAEFKTDVLKNRQEARQQLAETRQQLDQMNQKQMALTAEREEIEQRIKQSDVQFYNAVGTLRPSSLQGGPETLYRLTDPANGRTVVYIRSNDTKLAAFIGQFIGVRGDLQNDPHLNLRIIKLDSCEMVNPAKVGQSVAAQIAPASLLPSGATAQTE